MSLECICPKVWLELAGVAAIGCLMCHPQPANPVKRPDHQIDMLNGAVADGVPPLASTAQHQK